MGQTVAAKVIDVDKLKANIEKEIVSLQPDQLPVNEFLDLVLPEVGDLRYYGDNKKAYAVVVHNDGWDDYDAYFTLMEVIERYYQTENGYELVSDAVDSSVDDGAETMEVFYNAFGVSYEDVPKRPGDEDDE